jgi:hypothetical protein
MNVDEVVAWYNDNPPLVVWNHHPSVAGLEVPLSRTNAVSIEVWLFAQLPDEDVDTLRAAAERITADWGAPRITAHEARMANPYEPAGYI